MTPLSQVDSSPHPVQPADARALAERGGGLGLLLDMELPITIRFGSTKMQLADLAGLNIGSIIELDRPPGGGVELLVNGAVVARGAAVSVDGNYGVRISEVAVPRPLVETGGSSSDASGQ